MSGKVNVIDLSTAMSWAKKWRKVEGTYNAHHEVHAFLVPKVDLEEVLAQGVDAVRVYLGVDENDVEKLMIVGTQYDTAADTYVDMVSGRSPEGDVFDFTMPCPPVCDPKSPLNKLRE